MPGIITGGGILSATGGGSSNPNNAIVPPSAGILPPQAFVDADMTREILNVVGSSSTLLLDNKGIVELSYPLPELFALLTFAPGFSFADNALSPASVDYILSSAASFGIGSQMLNISGGSNAVPIPASPGPSFEESPYITSMVTSGSTVIVNEYINRIDDTDGIEVVTYAP